MRPQEVDVRESTAASSLDCHLLARSLCVCLLIFIQALFNFYLREKFQILSANTTPSWTKSDWYFVSGHKALTRPSAISKILERCTEVPGDSSVYHYYYYLFIYYYYYHNYYYY